MPFFSLCSRAALLFSSFAIVAACSSGTASSTGSSGAQTGGAQKVKTCRDTKLNHPTTAADDACNACSATKCSMTSTAALGSDPNAFGGACADLVQCECDCDAADNACLLTCVPKETPACKTALDAARACDHSTCMTECGADGG